MTTKKDDDKATPSAGGESTVAAVDVDAVRAEAIAAERERINDIRAEGAKAPDNLLKLGMSFARLGDDAEACAAFDQLAESFPDATQPIKQRAQRERARITCP